MEHVIPESLGNTEYVLEKGLVCDSCNNYFSIKIEGPLLEMPFFRQSRYKRNILSKKGKIPADKGFVIDPDLGQVLFAKNKQTGFGIEIPDERIRKSLKNEISVFVPEFDFFDSDNSIVSKFLAKIAIEGLAFDVQNDNENIETIVNQPGFDPIKRYCRFANVGELWPYRIRRVSFPEVSDGTEASVRLKELIFEYEFIYLHPGYFLFQLYLLGIEFTIDMVNPTCEQVDAWFEANPWY